MSTTEPQERTGSRDRSPSYPGIPLETAVERAKTVWAKEKRNMVPMKTLTMHWGYKSEKTGPATVTYSALKKFGLLDEEGRGAARQAKLTPLALDIILKPDHKAELRTAALNPKIHAEFWELYKNELPSDDALTHVLITERQFTPSGASDFLREYRATLTYSGLDSAGTVSGEEFQDDQEREDLGRDPKPKPKAAGMVSIPVMVPGGDPIYIEGRFPVSEPQWTQFIAVLTAMKPGLVAESPRGTPPVAEAGDFLMDPPTDSFEGNDDD